VDDCPRWSSPAGNKGRAKANNPTEARPFAFQQASEIVLCLTACPALARRI
jgi:hypothetical protein